ncbi:LysR family transcriptional regulator [uncultured Roseibium sp.]|uniref:LysR family transcriptional regulator n=1 Tax=uncultured Roseibium sp. TaxID=1936171 RepID=UPI002633F7A2|nr:LysR family transcriptional regulator [uncultured Roseibium sp.]
MNISQISAFRAVMTSSSISEAARKLGRTQPAVSLAIRSLEESLGLALFERKGRQMVPVPEAHYLHAESEEILDRLSSVTRTMRSLAGGNTGDLNVTAMPGPAAFIFPRFVASVIDDLEKVNLSITSRSSQQIEELARSQSIDFGFCDAPARIKQSAQYEIEIISAGCFVAMPSTHDLPELEPFSIRALDGVPMGGLQPSHTHEKRSVSLFAEHGLHYRKVVESQTFMPLLQFVRTGKCLALVDPLSVVNELELMSTGGEVVFRRLDCDLRYDYAILSPVHRPLSQIAHKVRSKWRTSLFNLLDQAGAEPRWEPRSALPPGSGA